MPQKNYPIMISVDWLSMTLQSSEVLSAPADSDNFIWRQRAYGTKVFGNVFDVEYVDENGSVEPFGSFCSKPNNSKWDARTCSLKLHNHLLYRDNRGYWLDLLRIFLDEYQCQVTNITRCDIAADFIKLFNGITGPAIIKNLKSFKWWKCGSVNIAEHYSMPYSVKWGKDVDKSGYDTEIFLQNKEVAPRVETMTFGTMASDCQVCLYDKTLEINRSMVRIERNEVITEESAKEYIRDCHKQTGVYDRQRHTWRLEIRLRNKACFLYDPALGIERNLFLDDLSLANLPTTFIAAANKYFKLVDATQGGVAEITPEYCESMRGHKNRLPAVDLFHTNVIAVAFSKKKYHEPANRFHRSVINRLDELGNRIKRAPAKWTKDGDKESIPNLIERLDPIADKMKKQRTAITKVKNSLNRLQKLVTSSSMNETSSKLSAIDLDKIAELRAALIPIAEAMTEHRTVMSSLLSSLALLQDVVTSPYYSPTDEDYKAVVDVRDMLERHYNTESPTFINNIKSCLIKYANKLGSMLAEGTDKQVIKPYATRPSDSVILLEAADIMKGIFVSVANDERNAAQHSIYEDNMRSAISLFNSIDYPDAHLLDMLYEYCCSKRWIEHDAVLKIIADYAHTNFFQWVRCNFDWYVYCEQMHLRPDYTCWLPPVLSPFEARPSLPYVQYTYNIQFTNL